MNPVVKLTIIWPFVIASMFIAYYSTEPLKTILLITSLTVMLSQTIITTLTGTEVKELIKQNKGEIR